MKAEAKLLRIVQPESGGPRKRSVLDAQATRYGEGPYLIDYMIAKGALIKYGRARGATWGIARAKRARAA